MKKAGVEKYFSLPNICVVGKQSIGKSSLLEQVIGHEILPIDNGMCTACPIEVQMTNIVKGKPYAVVGG